MAYYLIRNNFCCKGTDVVWRLSVSDLTTSQPAGLAELGAVSWRELVAAF